MRICLVEGDIMKKKKKMIIPIIFVLIFIIAMLSGCVSPDEFPIATRSPDVSDEYDRIQLKAELGYPFCLAKNHTFVYDTEPHNNWEDYEFKEVIYNLPNNLRKFFSGLFFDEVQHGVTYYVRAVAYCYDFKRPFQEYQEGYYQGEERTFYIDL